MIDLIIEQAVPKAEASYWTIDLDENDLIYDEGALRTRFIGEKAIDLGAQYEIVDVEFYSIVKNKIVLVTVKL